MFPGLRPCRSSAFILALYSRIDRRSLYDHAVGRAQDIVAYLGRQLYPLWDVRVDPENTRRRARECKNREKKEEKNDEEERNEEIQARFVT